MVCGLTDRHFILLLKTTSDLAMFATLMSAVYQIMSRNKIYLWTIQNKIILNKAGDIIINNIYVCESTDSKEKHS